METPFNELRGILCKVQAELEVPKDRNNAFGGFKYRKCEDILRAVKPLLTPHGVTVVLSDEIVQVGEWFFVKSTATIGRGEASFSCTAYARHAEERKGMDAAQVTGSASSYARKYALCGLFGISDADDPDDPPQAAPGVTPAALPLPNRTASGRTAFPVIPNHQPVR